MYSISDDSEIDPVVTKKPDSAPASFESIMAPVKLKEKHKITRAEILLHLILQSEAVTIEEESKLLYINQEPKIVQVSNFLNDLQQLTRKIDQSEYCQILAVLPIEPEFVANTYAKQTIQAYEIEQEFFPTQQSPQSGSANPKRGTTGKMTKSKRQTKKRANRKNAIASSSERKTVEQHYSKGPASFGSPKRLHTQSKMSMAKVRSYLETKPSFTKYRLIRLNFPRLRVIVKDINEIWSLDLAHVYKLAKYNRDVNYLLVAVVCLSRNLIVEPMKTKYATEAAQAFIKMITYKQPLMVWVDDGKEFLGAFESLCEKIYWYLEEKWTDSDIDKLDQFVSAINSRVKRFSKLAPNEATKKDVPRLDSLSAQTSILQKLEF